MKQKKYLYTLYLIITTIVISIVTQIYFNYKNYQKNRQQFINEVQISLDNATDVYYAELIKTAPVFDKLFTDIDTDEILSVSIDKNSTNASLTIVMDSTQQNSKKTFISKLNNKPIPKSDSTEITVYLFDGLFEGKSNMKMDWDSFDEKKGKSNTNYFKFPKGKATDSIKFIRNISKLFRSITNDSLNFKKLDSIVKTEFHRKNIQLPYQLNHYRFGKIIASNKKIDTLDTIRTFSKSIYLKRSEKIELIYPNQTKTYLKRGLLGILLSLILSIAIIASLFYLLNIIKKQKAIAEIKNDFISNITHEFKTPITTIGLALEGIGNFSEQEKKQKTKEYLDITNNQLQKLNVMVEKILETSSLDSKNLLLHKEPANVIELIEKIITKFKVSHPEKELLFNTNITKEILHIDIFHFENAMNNIIDNACKYGGNLIEIVINSAKENVIISISDSGNIPKNQKQKIFDKFYRIPQGNQHDVKGFGIGLYYSKKIIEKHSGTIELLATDKTQFKITIPK